MLENANRAGRGPKGRALYLTLGLLAVAALGAGGVAAQAQAGQGGAAPEQLTEAELLSRISAAPDNMPDFSATATVEQTVVPEGLLGASRGENGDSIASGPRSARVWHGGPDQVRAELLGANGDRTFVKNGDEVRIYDGAANTLTVGEKPADEAEGIEDPPEAANPEEINEVLAEISPTSTLTTGPPVQFAGRWVYPLTLEPKDRNLTLVERAEALVDAEAFVPLRFELYAEGNPEPVVRYEASDFRVGAIPDDTFELPAPPNATVEQMEGPDEGERRDDREEYRDTPSVSSVEEAQGYVDFRIRQPAQAPGGRELTGVAVKGDGVVTTYGSGWGTVVLAQGPEEGTEEQESEAGGVQIPTVDLGGGVTAREISTPIGTVLRFSAGGQSYSLAGSVPAAELQTVARDLLTSS